MLKIFVILSLTYRARGQLAPLIYAAPSAVSHQSRVDIKHTPGFISAPLIYSPATTIFASQPQRLEVASDTVLTPILTPIAFSFYHNLPLARALEHPISIEAMQESANIQNNESSEEKENAIILQMTTETQRVIENAETPGNPNEILATDHVNVEGTSAMNNN